MRTSVLIVGLLLIPISYADAQIPTVERDALIELYDFTGGVGWTDNTGWRGPVGTECTWYGVECFDGHVTSIDLYWNYLWGMLPLGLGDIENLVSLNLSYNALGGSIPSELGKLGGLENLRLEENGLNGSIPSGLGSASNLLHLNLSNNQLTGSIPPEMGNLSSLQELHLENNQLTGIPPEFGNLGSLRFLYLENNQLTGSIPPEMGNLSSLQELHLNNNQLTGIPPEFGNLGSLQLLYLENNQLTGSIPPELGNLSQLAIAHFEDNQLSGSIPSEFGQLSLLRYLYLDGNDLSGSIPPEMGNLTLLQLYVGDNRLSGSIPPEMGNLTSLVYLCMEDNQLSGSIPPELGNLSTLQKLYLQGNKLSGSIPPELGNLSILQKLFLQGNKLSGSIPVEITGLTGLLNNKLDLRWNVLHSDDPTVVGFVNSKQLGGDFQATQTVAPDNLAITSVGDHTVWLSWDLVTYTADPGGYEAFYQEVGSGSWASGGHTSAKTEMTFPVTGLGPGISYDFTATSFTLPHPNNQNLVNSHLSGAVMATTANLGCAQPVITVDWGPPVTLTASVQGTIISYLWSTGETSSSITVDSSPEQWYWVTVTSFGSCEESAAVLVGPPTSIFQDGFESGDTTAWSVAIP